MMLVDRGSEPMADPGLVGAKAARLHWMAGLGMEVPGFVVLSREAFDAVRALPDVARVVDRELNLLDQADPGSFERAARAISRAFARATLPSDVQEAVRAALASFGPRQRLAVRSSAVGEDGRFSSHAGQLDSFVGVRGPKTIERAIRACWASAYSARGLAYRLARGLPEELPVGVVLQAMVEPVASGVLFTADPETGDRDLAVVVAAWGLGEGVVQGLVPVDTYRIDSAGRVEASVAHKDVMLVPGQGRPKQAPVPEGERDARCLSEAELRELVRLARRVEAAAGAPQDMEWALDHDRVFHLLQTRPITTLPAGRRVIWDNSNIVESYSGTTTALTYTFARRAYETVYQQFCEVMGVDPGTIRRHRPTFRTMIGFIQGRVYYNLGSWYQVLAMLPGFGFNKGFMEQMMGVSEAASLEDGGGGPGVVERYATELPRLMRLVVRLLANLGTLERRVSRFGEAMEQARRTFRGADLDSMGELDLLDLYYELERNLLWNWKAPIINDFFAMIAFGVLKAVVERLRVDDPGSLVNRLLSGDGGLESTAPTRGIMDMARRLEEHPALLARLAGLSPTEALAEIREAGDAEWLRELLDRHLERWGYRCMDELKLESPTLKDDPTFLVSTLLGYATRGGMDPGALEAAGRRARVQAEAELMDAVPRPWRPVVSMLLGQARARIRQREEMRFWRTEVFGMVREIFRAMAARLVERGLLEHRDDVFHLTLDELFGVFDGTAVTLDLRGLVALRRAEAEGWREVPPRFETRGMVAGGRWVPVPSKGEALGEGDLEGTPCSPGRVTGRVRVVTGPDGVEGLQGRILATERTDPGWVPLYPLVSGLLVERGSLLSHSAIVARELGLPTIVGIEGLTRVVPDGATVTMDGSTGLVTLHPEAADHA